MRDGQRRILLNRLGDRLRRTRSSNTSARRFRTRTNYNRALKSPSRRNRSYSKRNSVRKGLRSRNGKRERF